MRMRTLIMASSCLLPPLWLSQLHAQDNGDTKLEEIVVTALRREQTVLSAPLSIQAATGDELVNQGINDLTSLRFTTPGYSSATDSGFTQIFIRGVGNSIYVGADPSVAQFIDDVPRIYGSASDTLFDVERVEVLKGAQGGLYGRNATGGVVNVITRQPSTDAFKAKSLGSYGEKDSLRAAGFINVPINDQLAFTVSAQRQSHDGYVKNKASATPYNAANFPTGAALPIPNGTTPIPVPGFGNVYAYTPQQTADFFNSEIDPKSLNDQDFTAVSGKVLWRPSDDFRLTIAADYYRKHDNTGSGWYNASPEVTQAVVAGFFQSLGVATNFPAGFITQPDEKFASAFGPPSHVYANERGVSATAVWNLGGFDLTSITAYRKQNTDFVTDGATSNVYTVPIDVRFHGKEMTYQELRLVSTFDGPWRVLGGATYLRNKQDGHTVLSLLTPVIPIGETIISDKINNWSAYSELGYDFTDKLTLSGSARYMHEKNVASFALPIESSTKATEHKIVPSMTLSYALPAGTAYARWARGFKAGGINTAAAPAFYPDPESDGSIFKPEQVDTYEVGYRQAVFDRTVQVTAAAFYNDYKDLQVLAYPRVGARDAFGNEASSTITTAVINAQAARTYGFEGSVNWQVLSGLNLGVNFGWLNTKYTEFQSDSTIVAIGDLEGERMLVSPKYQYSFNANLDTPISSNLRLVGNLLVSHNTSTIFQYLETNPVTGEVAPISGGSYWITNARIGVKTADDKYGFAIVGDNLFNKAYFVQGSNNLGNSSLSWGNPRVIRGEFTVEF